MEQGKYIDKPLVSVIVPSYNHEAYIEECILSIVSQTYKNIELIVIDDGSADHSREILERLQAQFGFVLVFQENQGVSKTLNKAIHQYAHGKYITGSASDDYLMPDKIERQVNYMESDPECSLVFGKVHVVDNNSLIIEGLTVVDPVEDPIESVRFEGLIEGNCIPAASVMYRKDSWEQCGGYNENSIIEDWGLWLEFAYSGKIVYLDEYFAYYRWHGSNVTANVLKMYTAAWETVQSWKDRMPAELARKVSARRDSLTFSVLSRIYKKESLRYLKFNHSYWDFYIVKNYMKGLLKLVFYWRKSYKVWK
ncbi:MAG: glycosyltransferase [Candidatus Azobacteroides sp.]|nr:glycosyltransferase [Candidatus Azobacteroides sp.]